MVRIAVDEVSRTIFVSAVITLEKNLPVEADGVVICHLLRVMLLSDS